MTHSPGTPEPTIPAAATRPPTILVAEGDLAFREHLRAALERRGFIVLVAARGSDAITIAQACRTEIAVLLANRHLFGMSGREAADAIRAGRPDIRVAFLADGATEAEADDDVPCFVKSRTDLGPLVSGVFELAS